MKRSEVYSASVIVLSVASLIENVAGALPASYFPYYATSLGAEIWFIGVFMAAFMVTSALLSSHFGSLSDRVGRKKLIQAGLMADVFLGTLTVGMFGVTDIISSSHEDELLRLTAGVERNSEHIIAKAIVEYAEEKGVKIPSVEDFKATPGRGAYGRIDEREVYVGGPNFLREMKIEIENRKIKELQEQGKTVVFTAVDGKFMGAFALSERIREESYKAVKQF